MNSSTKAEPKIVAHRGASQKEPENTLAAFKRAWEMGADAVECDVWLTKDEQVVCIHDRDTRRTTGQSMDVTKTTLKQLRTLNAGKGEKIPTLTELLATIPKDKYVVIEVKGGWKILSLLPALLKSAEVEEERVVIISFDKDVIRKAKEFLAKSKALLLMSFKYNRANQSWSPSTAQVVKAMKETGADGVSLGDATPANEELFEAVHGAGGSVHVWTVNDPAVAKRYSKLGVVSITTDNPELMLHNQGAE